MYERSKLWRPRSELVRQLMEETTSRLEAEELFSEIERDLEDIPALP
jgi:hypothetical protein